MATFTKRTTGWKAEVCVNRIRRSKTLKSKRAAQVWALNMEATLTKGDARLVTGYRLYDALERYRVEVAPTHKGWKWESVRLLKLQKDPIAKTLLMELNVDDLHLWSMRSLQKLAPASVRREYVLLRSTIRCAYQWRWMPEPRWLPLFETPQKPKDRNILVTDRHIEAICDAAGLDTSLSGFNKGKGTHQTVLAFMIAVETAMRQSEIICRDWKDVSLRTRVITLEDDWVKNGHGRGVPLSSRAVELWSMMGPPKRKGRVFSITPGTCSTTFRNLRDRTKLAGFTFHDSRHTAITRLAKKLPVLDLARAVGHRDLKSLLIYYNESAESLAQLLD